MASLIGRKLAEISWKLDRVEKNRHTQVRVRAKISCDVHSLVNTTPAGGVCFVLVFSVTDFGWKVARYTRTWFFWGKKRSIFLQASNITHILMLFHTARPLTWRQQLTRMAYRVSVPEHTNPRRLGVCSFRRRYITGAVGKQGQPLMPV